jgi:mRNA deadenylase 3'-5' endonuclease subunit Ccr4
MRWALGILVLLGAFRSISSLVRLASWNLLAPCYAKPNKYPWCNPQDLDWEYRKSIIIPRLLEMDADIICLQEVQVDLWQDLYQTFQEHNYNGVIQNVTGGHNVASALLIKDSCPLQLERLESRSRVLIAVLHDPRQQLKVYLANVHLEAGEKEGDNLQRYHQLKSLFKRLSRQIQADNILLDEASIIMAGDFNMLRTNPLHSFMTQGLLQSPEQLKNLPAFSTIQLFDAYLDFQDDDACQPRLSKILFFSSNNNKTEVLQRTYAMGDVLDYVWHSRSLTVQDTLLFHPLACNTFPQKWPSQDHPSDHLPIGVDFEWNEQQ